ncbi:MAG: CBS domain-containing protein [Desulfatirhabdiaceae bacterium]
MQIPITSMEQLMPFPTAQEMIKKQRTGIVSITPGTMVLEAVQLMTEKNIRFLPVMANGTLAGMLSERDCAKRVILGNLSPGTTPVSDIMEKNVRSVPPESKIPECIAIMYQKDVGYLPVMRGKEVIGVLSIRELMGALIERHERLLRRLGEERLTLLYPDPSSY